MRMRAAAIAFAIAVLRRPAASAAPWKRVTSPDGASTDQVGLARTGDGVLHLAWSHPTGPEHRGPPSHGDLPRAARSGRPARSRAGGPASPTRRWSSTPAGCASSGAASAPPTRATRSGDEHRALDRTAARAGRCSPGQVVPDGAQSYGSNTVGDRARRRHDAAGLRRHARHVGPRRPLAGDAEPRLPGADRAVRLRPEPRHGRDEPDRHGVVLERERPPRRAGAGRGRGRQPRSARRATMPGTSDMQVGMLGRTPLVARAGGGFYVAYPTGYPTQNRVRLWRVGAVERAADRPRGRLRQPRGRDRRGAATGGCGSLWTKGFGDPRRARRAARTGTRRDSAPAVNAGHPKDAAQAYKLDASAAGGALDVLGNFNIGDHARRAVTSYRRILPGLTLRGQPGRVRRGEPTDGALHRPRRRRRP